MITKIASNEYLKRIGNMTVAERNEYLKRVGEWIERQAPMLMQKAQEGVARFQNAIQCSVGWNDDECRAWEDGVRLLTAMVGEADTWLPEMIYVMAAKRSIHQMVAVLEPVGNPTETVATQQAKKPLPMIKEVKREYDAATDTVRVQMEVVPPATHGDSPSVIRSSETSLLTAGTVPSVKATPVRPKHIDQYVHLLPEKTQQRAAQVQGLLRDLDKARENARLLMNDPKAKSDSVAQWAKTATALDAKVKSIYKELDAEWDKLVATGTVTVDDFGNARIVVVREGAGPEDSKHNEDKGASPDNNDADKKKRVEYLKKWLRDSRTKATDERRKQWEQNYKELLSLGGEPTDSIRKAGKFYGVDLSKVEFRR